MFPIACEGDSVSNGPAREARLLPTALKRDSPLSTSPNPNLSNTSLTYVK